LDVAYFSKVLDLPSIQVYQSVVSLCCTKQDDEEGSSSLKLELAQYRELAGFEKFGSDMDEESRKLLARGALLTELLKQPQYSPLPVAKQIILVYAGIKGYLNKIPTNKIGMFEKKLFKYLDESKILLPYLKSLETMTNFDLNNNLLIDFFDYFMTYEFKI